MSGDKSTRVKYDPRGEMVIRFRNYKGRLQKLQRTLQEEVLETGQKSVKFRNEIKNDTLLRLIDSCLKDIEEITERNHEREAAIIKNDVNPWDGIGLIKNAESQIKQTNNLANKDLTKIRTIGKKLAQIYSLDRIIEELEKIFTAVGKLHLNYGEVLNKWVADDYRFALQQEKRVKKNFANLTEKLAKLTLEKINVGYANDLYNEIQEYYHDLDRMAMFYSIKDSKLQKVNKVLYDLKGDLQKQTITVADPSLAKSFSQLLGQLREQEEVLKKNEPEGIEEKVEEIGRVANDFKKAAVLFEQLELERNELMQNAKDNRELLGHWAPGFYDKCQQISEAGSDELDRCRREITSGDLFDFSILENISSQVNVLASELTVLMPAVIEKEEAHQKRLYLIKSLREVCASLGFQEKGEPYYHEEGDRASTVIQEFDTMVYGDLVFRFTLDGKLESSSGIAIEDCGDKYVEISQMLADEFGINTDFRLTDGTKPLRKTRSARDLPREISENSKENRGGS